MKQYVKLVKQTAVKALVDHFFSSKNFPNFSPQLSVRKLINIKVKILVRFTVESILYAWSERNSLRGLKNYSSLKKNCSVLVIANGPTVKNLNLIQVKRYKDLGKLEVFGVNFSILDLQYEKVIDYLVLSDPATHPNCKTDRATQLWEKVLSQSTFKVITPTSWHKDLKGTVCRSLGCLHFEDKSLEGFTLNINPTKPRGYVSLTAYKALAVALFFEYERTFVIGMDNSMFRSLTVDEDNNLIQFSNHGVGGYPSQENYSIFFTGGIFDYFYDLSEAFRTLKFCFGIYPVINLGLRSEVDCFSKIKPTDSFYALVSKNRSGH